MRGVASLVVVAALGGVLWVGLSYRTSQARDEADSPIPIVRLGNVETDLESGETLQVSAALQREQLNQRLHTMLSEGKGLRLTDETSRRVAQAASNTTGFGGRTARYTPPRLDLSTPPNIPNNDLDCLTQAIYYEARNESEAGQAAVAEVVMNRVRHSSYPNRVCEVVYQRNSRTCQFTFTCDGSMASGVVRQSAWARAQRIAREVLEGRSTGQLPANSLNYHANYVRPSWGQRLARVRQIGAHIFYGAPLNEGLTPVGSEVSRNDDRLFVRNEATEKAYESLIGQPKDANET